MQYFPAMLKTCCDGADVAVHPMNCFARLDGKGVAKFDAHPELQRMTDVYIAAVAADSEDEGTIKRIVVLRN